MKRNASREDVLLAIEEGRLRVNVQEGSIEIRRGIGPRAQWRPAKLELVKGPHQKLPYARVTFGREARGLLHRIVWWAAGKTIPKGKEINHKDGNKLHCAIHNLELMTPGQNQKHAYRTGLSKPSYSTSIFSDDEVRSIRADRTTGMSNLEITLKYGKTDPSTMSKIARGLTYSHIK